MIPVIYFWRNHFTLIKDDFLLFTPGKSPGFFSIMNSYVYKAAYQYYGLLWGYSYYTDRCWQTRAFFCWLTR